MGSIARSFALMLGALCFLWTRPSRAVPATASGARRSGAARRSAPSGRCPGADQAKRPARRRLRSRAGGARDGGGARGARARHAADGRGGGARDGRRASARPSAAPAQASPAFALGCALGTGGRGVATRRPALSKEPATAPRSAAASRATATGPTVGTLTGAAGTSRDGLRLEDVLRRLRDWVAASFAGSAADSAAPSARSSPARDDWSAGVAIAARPSARVATARSRERAAPAEPHALRPVGWRPTTGDVRDSVITSPPCTFSFAPCSDELTSTRKEARRKQRVDAAPMRESFPPAVPDNGGRADRAGTPRATV